VLADPEENLIGFCASSYGDESNNWTYSSYYMIFEYVNGKFEARFRQNVEGSESSVRGLYAGNRIFISEEDNICAYWRSDYSLQQTLQQ
jgi:hypothetical protein